VRTIVHEKSWEKKKDRLENVLIESPVIRRQRRSWEGRPVLKESAGRAAGMRDGVGEGGTRPRRKKGRTGCKKGETSRVGTPVQGGWQSPVSLPKGARELSKKHANEKKNR